MDSPAITRDGSMIEVGELLAKADEVKSLRIDPNGCVGRITV